MAVLSYTAAEIDERLGKAETAVQPENVPPFTGKNLLINPFFTVNQRNEYNGQGYHWDCWRNANSAANISRSPKEGGGVHLETPSGVNLSWFDFVQLFDEETSKALAGKTVTITVDTSDMVNADIGFLLLDTPNPSTLTQEYRLFNQIWVSQQNTYTFTLPDTINYHLGIALYYRTSGTAGSSMDLNSVKIELGSVSTLANDVPPNYTEELLKCQRYLYTLKTPTTWSFVIANGYASSATEAMFVIPTPAEMIANPTVDYSRVTWSVVCEGTSHSISAATVSVGNGAIFVRITTTGLTVNKMCALRMSGNAGVGYGLILFSAEL